jgi:hypothetical protein
VRDKGKFSSAESIPIHAGPKGKLLLNEIRCAQRVKIFNDFFSFSKEQPFHKNGREVLIGATLTINVA